MNLCCADSSAYRSDSSNSFKFTPIAATIYFMQARMFANAAPMSNYLRIEYSSNNLKVHRLTLP